MALPGHDRLSPPDGAYTCDVRRRERVSEIALSGELDIAARPRLDAALRAALDGGPTDALLVDLTAVTFADSSALHWLTETKRQADAAGARLSVATVPGPVRDLLALAGLDGRLTP
jgi:anti-anti-sigma factor